MAMNIKTRLIKLEEQRRDNETPSPIGIIFVKDGETQEDARKRTELLNGQLPSEVMFIRVRSSDNQSL